jgi:hypothetical protein
MFPIHEYEEQIDSLYQLLSAHKDLADIRLSEEKWTLKEMLSHLIDSASNNHQRFIRMQLEPILEFPAYGAENWRDITKITDFDFSQLLDLWKNYNAFLIHLIKNMNEEAIGNIWKTNGKELTMQFLVEDYFIHLNWHMELYKTRIAELRSSQN